MCVAGKMTVSLGEQQENSFLALECKEKAKRKKSKTSVGVTETRLLGHISAEYCLNLGVFSWSLSSPFPPFSFYPCGCSDCGYGRLEDVEGYKNPRRWKATGGYFNYKDKYHQF